MKRRVKRWARGDVIRVAMLAATLAAGLGLAACGQNAATGGGGGGGPKPVNAEKEVAALGAPASAEVKAMYDGEFEAVGSEPFWRLDLLNDWASFTRPGLQEVGGLPGRKDYRAEGARIVAGPLVITLRAGECVHESGEKFPYKAQVDFDGVSYEGCARRGEASSGSESWSAVLKDLLPAIDACLTKVDSKPARVTIAYVLDNGQASVRLLDAEGGRYECSVAAAGGPVADWGALADKDVLPGENDPLFTRTPGPAPKDACSKNEEAKGPSGKLLGWLTHKTC